MKKTLMMLALILFLLSACQTSKQLLLVTTTSVENSGLLDYLLPHFEDAYNINIKVVAVGTGAALNYGRLGQADILIVHDAVRERTFIESGYGVQRETFMFNTFIVVGPQPIEYDSFEHLLETIHASKPFLSRGDQSGTHAREQLLFELFNLDVASMGNRYKESGQGMESTLMMASIMGYYTLTDKGTYLAMKDRLDLDIVFEHHETLINPYSVIFVNPDLHPRDTTAAHLFYDWLIEDATKQLIKAFTINNEPLFYPYE